MANTLRDDAGWIRQAFFVPDTVTTEGGAHGASYRDRNYGAETYSSADLKFTDTTPGGNFVINPKPQITRHADPKRPGINPGSRGMGGIYSRMFDDNKQVIHLQFGFPEFNSMTNFWGRYHDTDLGHFANTGDARKFTFYAGKIVGYILTAPFQVVSGVVNFATRLWKFATNTPYSKFYYMKPAMPVFISRWTDIFNRVAVGMGIVNGPGPENVDLSDEGTGAGINYKNGMSSAEFEVMSRMLPDVMRKDGGIDLYALMTRGQRLANNHYKKLKQIEESVLGQGKDAYTKAVMNYMNGGFQPDPPARYYNLPDYMEGFYKTGTIGQGVGATDPEAIIGAGESSGSASAAVNDKAASRQMANQAVEVARVWDDASMLQYFEGELTDGGAFLSLAVDYEGTASESFSNSFRKSDLEEALNSFSSKGRSMWFNLSGGNVADNAVMNGIEGFMGGVKSFVEGTLSSVGLGGLSQMGGQARVDMPEFWDACSAEMPSSNYSVTLSTPYGNKLSILKDLYLVTTALIAAACPISTGRNAYTSPMLCSLYSQSRSIIPLGMIESLNIERGGSGIGWSEDGLPTQIKISFSVKNLSTVMHMPIGENAGLSKLMTLSMLDEETTYTDYMAVLSGLSLADRYYSSNRIKLAWRNQIAAFESWLSPAAFASHAAGTDTLANKVIGSLMRAGSR